MTARQTRLFPPRRLHHFSVPYVKVKSRQAQQPAAKPVPLQLKHQALKNEMKPLSCQSESIHYTKYHEIAEMSWFSSYFFCDTIKMLSGQSTILRYPGLRENL